MDGKIFQGVCLHAGREFGVVKCLHKWEQRDVGFAFLKSIKGRVESRWVLLANDSWDLNFPMF